MCVKSYKWTNIKYLKNKHRDAELQNYKRRIHPLKLRTTCNETFERVQQGRANKCPISLTDRWRWWQWRTIWNVWPKIYICCFVSFELQRELQFVLRVTYLKFNFFLFLPSGRLPVMFIVKNCCSQHFSTSYVFRKQISW